MTLVKLDIKFIDDSTKEKTKKKLIIFRSAENKMFKKNLNNSTQYTWTLLIFYKILNLN